MLNLNVYRYTLPKALIAQSPAEPRDHARLFVYDTRRDTVSIDLFANVSNYLPLRSLLVLNDTRVMPARVTLHKASGGKVVALFLLNELRPEDTTVKGIVDRKLEPRAALYLSKEQRGERFDAVKQDGPVFFFRPNFAMKRLPELLREHGSTPIPPYLKHVPLQERELRERYQSIFAKHEASIAAPTASLHFTEQVFKRLDERHIEKAFVTLHVGRGTFAPVGEEQFKRKKLHEERFEIPRASFEAIAAAKREGRTVVAVGTTVVRTLESAPRLANPDGRRDLLNDKTMCLSGRTDLFIYPPYNFKMADMLITNFHVPRSSLMCLADAFLQHKKAKRSIIELYRLAIAERFRFFSFGDAMLIK